MRQADFEALRAAQAVLRHGLQPQKLRSARRKVQSVSVRVDVRELEHALDALDAMSSASSAEAVALGETAECAARTYWNEPGPVRSRLG